VSPHLPGGRALWGDVCSRLRHRIGERNFATWIAPLRSTWTGDTLALEAPDRITRDRVARHFLVAIEQALAEAIGGAQAVRLDVAPAGAPAAIASAPAVPLPRCAPSAGHTFDGFVVGESNRAAYAAACRVAEEPNASPLFLHGPSGVGKTHLLHAIFHALGAAGVAVACLAAAQLVAALLAACEARTEAAFWSELSLLGGLLLDDVHSVRGLPEIQERLIDGLALWVAAGRLLVLTSDRAPHETPALLGGLQMHFEGTVVAAIASPDAALRRAILEQKARARGLSLDARLATRLATELGGSVRRLEGAFTRLLAHARLSGRPLDEALAVEVLPELRRRTSEALTVERIVEATADAFRVSARRVLGPSRQRELLLPRQVAMYLARELLGRPYVDLAAGFARDHTSVMHARRAVAARLEHDAELAATVERLARRLRQGEAP